MDCGHINSEPAPRNTVVVSEQENSEVLAEWHPPPSLARSSARRRGDSPSVQHSFARTKTLLRLTTPLAPSDKANAEWLPRPWSPDKKKVRARLGGGAPGTEETGRGPGGGRRGIVLPACCVFSNKMFKIVWALKERSVSCETGVHYTLCVWGVKRKKKKFSGRWNRPRRE